MEFGLWELLAAFGGGLFGAAIGALPAFIFTGFFILVGSIAELGGSAFDMVFEVGLGVIFGPHIAFGGAVAATAYAAWRKKVDDGKNILVGLAGLNNSGILLIVGIFGAIGYTLEKFIVLGVGDFTDTIALTVIISAIRSEERRVGKECRHKAATVFRMEIDIEAVRHGMVLRVLQRHTT